MAEFIEVIKQRERMCENTSCEVCILACAKNKKGMLCTEFLLRHPDEAESIIMNWAKEHPFKTNLDKFMEVFKLNKDVNEYVLLNEEFWYQEYKED